MKDSLPPHTYRFFASCPGYLESLLAEEIGRIAGSSLGYLGETSGGVYFDGGLEAAYRTCLWSRLASRVYYELASQWIEDKDGLYELAREVSFETFFDVAQTFSVSAHSAHHAFRHSNLASLVVKDAVADRFRAVVGERPSVDPKQADVGIYVHVTKRKASVYLDLCGESLHRRGYREQSTEAPLRENTAAAVLIRAGWPDAVDRWSAGDAPLPFLADPMCGSGTLAIEAALMATDTAPGMLRPRFAFEALAFHDSQLLLRLQSEARRRRSFAEERWGAAGGRIRASDIDPKAVSATRRNAAAAGVDGILQVSQSDFLRLSRGAILGELNKDYDSSADMPYFIVTNPPYGRRMTGESTGSDAELYERLGHRLSQHFLGFRAAVLAESKGQAQRLGLRAERVNTLYNGNLKIVLALIPLEASNTYRPPQHGTAAGAPPDSGMDSETGSRLSRETASRPDQTQGHEMLMNRLKKNRRTLKKYLERESIGCYRIYDADIPQYAAAVDIYTDRRGHVAAVIQEYRPPATVDAQAAEQRLSELVTAVRAFFELSSDAVYLKERRRRSGSDQYARAASGLSESAIVEEDGLWFEVNYTDYLDTGLFLDHRHLRRDIRRAAKNRRFLNLFAYTCTASVYAAAGGAQETLSVDTSNTYLEWGTRNFAHNGFSLEAHRFLRADSRDVLREATKQYDLIFIDPPTFSNSKGYRSDFDVQRDHPELIRGALSCLAPSGEIIFSANARSFTLSDELSAELGETAGAEITDISEKTLPPDFSRRAKHRHVYRIRKVSSS